MRKLGVRIDVDKLDKMALEYEKNISKTQKKLDTLCKFPIDVAASFSIKKAFTRLPKK